MILKAFAGQMSNQMTTILNHIRHVGGQISCNTEYSHSTHNYITNTTNNWLTKRDEFEMRTNTNNSEIVPFIYIHDT